MTVPLDSDNQDRHLWRLYFRRAAGLQTPEIDPNTLAAYLDGSADAEQIELVDTRLASDPLFLQELMDLRRVAVLDTNSASASVLHRAMSLGRLRIWPARVRWAGAAAGVLLACLIGYSAGSTTGQSQRHALAAGSVQASFQLDDLISEPAFGIILPLNGENGR